MKRTVAAVCMLPLLLAFTAAAAPSRGGVMLRSALLPGWGQMSLGHRTRGVVYMSLELATWAGVGLSYLEGTFGRNDYTWLAASEAGIDVSGRPGSFLDDVSNFASSSEYNDYIRRLARYYYPDDPDAQRSYFESRALYGDDSWEWSSDTFRSDFRDRLRESRQWFRRSVYIAAFAIVNRAVSMIDASLLDERNPGVYTSLDFPDRSDLASFRFTIGARF